MDKTFADSAGRLRRAHQRLHDFLPRLEGARKKIRPADCEEVIFELFRIESEALYDGLCKQYADRKGETAMLRALREGLVPLKVMVLAFLDDKRVSGRPLAVELRLRIKLEEDYLIPMLKGIAGRYLTSNKEL
ncbi:MAG: hypothetical protein KC897_04475 [Candidatus Omnitrophica bacterium]|nr:hypothetical protein [Candidatus Omnitrophota bacterium]MCB9721380.1 hypothetical protein [Candidatus Omnitrophota bacterium]